MQFVNIIAIAVALALDAFTVAIAAGVSLQKVSFRQKFRLSWHFGFFQAMMPVIGWGAGIAIQDYIAKYDHWLAFCLLSFVGVGMLRSSFSKNKKNAQKKDPSKGMTMVMLSIATSIDALAVGLSLSMIRVSIWIPSVVIGITAGIFTLFGLYLGKTFGRISGISKYAEAVGGLVLLAIGFNILHEHGALKFFF